MGGAAPSPGAATTVLVHKHSIVVADGLGQISAPHLSVSRSQLGCLPLALLLSVSQSLPLVWGNACCALLSIQSVPSILSSDCAKPSGKSCRRNTGKSDIALPLEELTI